jgi:hypothetical protein
VARGTPSDDQAFLPTVVAGLLRNWSKSGAGPSSPFNKKAMAP